MNQDQGPATGHLASLLAGFLFTAAPLAAAAATDSVVELPPLVVTGELWETSLTGTSSSVSVLGARELESAGALHFEDVLGGLPNLTWTGGTSRPRYLQIRGIGENSQFEGETPDSSVRFLIDDLDFTGLGGVAALFDVEQVEVLRGPQAGAFGANAAGGLVKLKTAAPTPFWTGRIAGTAGGDGLAAGGFALGGPLLEDDPERLTFRIAAYRETADGFRDNRHLDRDDTNERDETMARLKLRWRPSGEWQWDAALLYADADNGYDTFNLRNRDFETFSDQPGRDEQESLAASLKGRLEGDAVAFTTITSVTGTDSFYAFDGDWTNPADPLFTYEDFVVIDRDRLRWSQELRLDSAPDEDAAGFIDRWTAGVYFESLEEDTGLGSNFGDFTTDYESRTIGVFGQVLHRFSPHTRLILGLRAEYFDLETRIDFRPDVDFDDTLFGGKLTLERDLGGDHTLFASAARGYKAGGANIYPFLTSDIGPFDYGTETLWNFEAGLRGTWLDGRLRGSATAFLLQRNEPQVRDSAGFGSTFSYFTDNGESATIYGLESEGRLRLADGWELSASLGLLDSELDAFAVDNAAGSPAGGRELANVPSYSYSLALAYDDRDGPLFGRLALRGRDAYFESNTHPEERDAFAAVDASIGYRRDGWTFTLWVRNLLDERYAKRVFFFDNGQGAQRYESIADPRQVGLTAAHRF
jgi:outer membrane receptor protein involved in Fe transport